MWKIKPDQHLIFWLGNIETKGIAIDIGCGTGADALYLANNYYEKVIAVDKDRDCILDEVKQHSNIEVINNDWEDYIKDKKFDFVYSRFSTFSCEQINLLLKATKKGGHLFIKTFSERISESAIISLVNKYYYTKRIYKIKDNHEPCGEHEHTVLFLFIKKEKKK